MEKKLLNPRKAFKHLIYKLQRVNFPHFIKFKASKNLYSHQKQLTQKGFSQSPALYMGKLYIEPSSSSIDHFHKTYNRVRAPGRASLGNIERQDCELEDEDETVGLSMESTNYTSLQLHGVDAEAEEFIRRRKEAWMIEKQKSAEDFFAMLARGT